MAATTSVLGLTKPEMSDHIDPSIFANNFDIIDSAINTKAEKVELDSARSIVDAMADRVVALENDVEELYLNMGSIGTILDAINGEVI